MVESEDAQTGKGFGEVWGWGKGGGGGGEGVSGEEGEGEWGDLRYFYFT